MTLRYRSSAVTEDHAQGVVEGTTTVTEEATTAVTKEESVADVTAEDSTTADNN